MAAASSARVVDGDGLVRDPVPGVPGLGPVGRGHAEGLEQHRVGEQLPDPLREQRRAAGRDQDAGGAVDHGVHLAADRGGDDRGAARHGLDGQHAGRVVLAEADDQVGGAQQRRQRGAAGLAGERHLAGHAEGVGELGQPAEAKVVAEVGLRRAAGHDQVGAGHLGHRAQQGGERVVLRQVGHGHQARPGGALGDRPLGGELVGVHAAGHDADRPAGDAEPGQVGLLVGAPGEHGARGAADRGLKADALGAGVTGDHVMPPLGDAKGVKRLHHGDPQVAGGRQGGEAAGPAQRVHHVGAVAAQALVQRAAEAGNLREQVGLAVLPVRGADVLHRDTRLKLCSLGGAVPLRVHGHLVALAGQRPAQLKQPRAARLPGSVAGQGHCLLCYQGDLHGASPHRMYPSRRAVEGPGGFSEKKKWAARARTPMMAWNVPAS